MRINELNSDTALTLQEWLSADIESALEHDPSVGIFASPDLASVLRELQSYVEEQTGVGPPIRR